MKSIIQCTFVIASLMQCHLAMATIYCSHGGGFLKTGMNKAQVEQLCGKPISQTKEKTYASRNVAINQLFYTIKKNTRSVYGPTYNEPTISLIVSVMNHKVIAITLQGNQSQAASVCPNGSIQVGAPVSAITQACGQPSYVNHSFKKIRQGNLIEQDIWQIKTSQYGQSLTLKFNNDTLVSIQ